MKKTFLLIVNIIIVASLEAQVLFDNQGSTIGLDLTCGNAYLGNGISFFDFDKDGWDDISLTTDDTQDLRFFKNVNGTFVEQTLNIPVLNFQTKQINWVDFDNDGDNDLFVTSDTDGVKLFENTASSSLIFQDISITAGFPTTNMFSYGASWGDYNNDGFLDVFVSNRNAFIGNKLYKNNGDGTFLDVSLLAGIDGSGHGSFCSVFFDFNNDGFQDIYISNDKPINPNILYKNNGDGTFSDVSVSSGTNTSIDAMTVTIDDYNSDGFEDIYITNGPAGNVFYQNNGDETFTDITTNSGTQFNSIGWGASFLDADNDKDLDLYVCGENNGVIPSLLKGAFYINNNNGTFSLSNSSFPNDSGSSYSSAIGDVDNDGYPDVVVSNANDEDLYFWKNTTSATNNWLKVNLEGVQSNRNGVGSKIEIAINGEKQYRYTKCGEGYLAQNASAEIFGLGNATTIDYIKVTWLSGIEDVILNVNANQSIDILEGDFSLSTIDFNYGKTISMYPNPTKDELVINTDNTISSYQIYSMLGAQIIADKTESNLIKINTSKLQVGTYFIKLIIKNTSYIKRFIKK